MAAGKQSDNVNLETIRDLIIEVRGIATENRECLAGSLQCPGVISRLDSIEQKFGVRMEALERLTSNHLTHMDEKMGLMFIAQEKLQTSKDEQHITWIEVAKEWVKPVITAVIVALLMTLLVKLGIII